LGLEITSSLFFFSAHPYSFSYFPGIDPHAEPIHAAKRLEDYLRAGWIDTNHAYGDFDEVGGFQREHALKCYEVLASMGVILSVFTNHGGAENIQNVGADASYHCGDRFAHPAYHADLMQQNRVRYIWTDSLVYPERIGIRDTIKNTLNPAPTSILRNCVLQDGQQFRGFTRLRSTGANAPNLSSLLYQLRQIEWEAFYKYWGAAIIYQHFGVLYRSAQKCYAATIEEVSARKEVLLAPFYLLEREHREGRLWVCGTKRLLTYLEMIEEVQVQPSATADRHSLIYPESIAQPEAFFQGLTLYIDPSHPVHVYYGDLELPIWHNGPDETGRYSVTIAVRKMENIW
jgi:hypothetical protein